MNPFDFLRRQRVGTAADGSPVYSSRNFRAFLIAMLAGGRTVVMNANIVGTVVCGPKGATIANCTMTRVEAKQ